jgi:invasion protein IalB
LKPMFESAVKAAVIAATLATCALAAAARAQEPAPRPHRSPPPEAFVACEGKKEAEACSVQRRDHTLTGVCAADDQARLFCRPDRPPPRDAEG